MADEISAIEKPAEKGTRVDMMKKLLTKVKKHLETLKAMKPRESMESVKEKLIACAQAVKKAKKDLASNK